MVTIPWRAGPAADTPGPTVTVMASRFELTTVRAVPSFLLASLTSWWQAVHDEGCVGVSLQARPWAREFWTLSAWTSRDAVYRYARRGPHAGAARTQTRAMRASTFVFWEVAPDALPVRWHDGKQRVWERMADPEAPFTSERGSDGEPTRSVAN